MERRRDRSSEHAKEEPALEIEGKLEVVNGISGEASGVVVEAPITPTELGHAIQAALGFHPSTQSLFINDGQQPYNASAGRLPKGPVHSLRIIRQSRDFEAKHEFLEQLSGELARKDEKGGALGQLYHVEKLTRGLGHGSYPGRPIVEEHRVFGRDTSSRPQLLIWLEEDDAFVQDALVRVAAADITEEFRGWALSALLSGAQSQLSPRPGLLARLARDTDLDTMKWLRDFPVFGRNRDFLLYSAAKHPGPHRKAGLRAAFNDPVAEREFMKVCVEHCGCVIQFTGWCSDMDLVHLAMRNDVRAFRHATEHIRNDPATALSAVARNGMLLEFASPRLRATRAVIQAAVSQNVFAFQFARLETPELRAFAATEVLKKLGVAGENVASDVRQHAAEAYRMCRTCPSLLQALQTLLREADTMDAGWLREFCLEGVKQEPSFYKALSKPEQSDMQIAMAAVRLDPWLFPHALPKRIRCCFDIQVAAVAKDVNLKYFVLPSDRVIVEKAAVAWGKAG